MQLHRAIVVDDEIFTRKGLLQLMDWEACGFEVVGEADNGEDALELIGSVHPDLVITDIRMPVLDGLELIRCVLGRGGGSSCVYYLERLQRFCLCTAGTSLRGSRFYAQAD